MRNGEHYKDPTAGKAMRRIRTAREGYLEEMGSLRTKPLSIETVSEANEQEAVMIWAAHNLWKYPCLRWMFHIPNGGYRNTAEAVHFKRMGVKPGVPDLFLPCPTNGYHGLWIEMKSQTGRPTALQTEWLEWLKEQGYAAYVCKGAEAAINCLKLYLEGGVYDKA